MTGLLDIAYSPLLGPFAPQSAIHSSGMERAALRPIVVVPSDRLFAI